MVQIIRHFHRSLVLICSTCVLSCGTSEKISVKASPPPIPVHQPAQSKTYPPLSFNLQSTVPAWVDSTLASLTLEEKVAQMVMARAYGHYISSTTDEYQRLARLVSEQKVGGLVTFQADVYEHAVLMNKLQRLAAVPLLVASDFERGIAMRVRRGTYFPEAMALGATRNEQHAYNVGLAIAEEARAIGVHQNFAPVADVNNNPSNPVINTRSFGEDVSLVSRMAAAYAKGLNDRGVVSTAKHFPGHGDTGVDSHLDLPTVPYGRARLDSLELATFKDAVRQGVMSVMIAHLEVPAIDSARGIPASLSPVIISSVLKGELGFQGLVVTDAMDMRGLVKSFSVGEASVRAVKAGVDILLIPANEEVAIREVVQAVRKNEISVARINESVARILLVKHWLGLHENRYVDIDHVADVVGNKEHARLAKQIARDAITLVKNDSAILPLQQYGKKRIAAILISDTEDNRTEVNRPGFQWTNEQFGSYFMQQFRKRYGSVDVFRLTPASNAIDFDSVLSKARRADMVLVPLYVKVRTSSGRIGIPERMEGFVGRLAELQKPAIIVSLGNPYIVGSFPWAKALMCAYSDAEVMVEASVEALFGEIEPRGKLPVTIPGQFSFGTGLTYPRTELRSDDPVFAGFDASKLERIDSLMVRSISDSAFPAAQVVVVKDGIIAFNKAFGNYIYERSSGEIDPSTLFDLASLTKVLATTTAVMKLYDQKKLLLTDSVGKYLSQFSSGKKADITIRHLLTHTAGFPPFRRLWQMCTTPEEALDSALATLLVANPGDTTIYSDLSMITLGKIVEKISGQPLDVYVKQEFFEPLKMVSTTFRPSKAIWPQCAPTELDTVWRKMLVQGIVHDENAAILGGVSGHAGLFSTASDVAIIMQMIMNGGKYGGVRYISDSTIALFTRRQSSSSTRALGWDTRSATGSSAGDLFSRLSFGHTGFTGTSIWADPERKLFVILLTNRVYPTRENRKIFKVRPALHDIVVQALSK